MRIASFAKMLCMAIGLVAALPSISTLRAQQPSKIDAAILQGAPTPDLLRVVTLVKASLATLNDANLTGDYTVMRKRAAPEFSKKNSVESLAKTFDWWRDKKIDLSPIIILRPEFPKAPRLTDAGVLLAAGVFRSEPLSIEFQMAWTPFEKTWRLDSLSIKAVPAPRTRPGTGDP